MVWRVMFFSSSIIKVAVWYKEVSGYSDCWFARYWLVATKVSLICIRG